MRPSRPVVAVAAGGAVVLVGVAVWVMGPGAAWVLHHLDGISGKGMSPKERADALDAIRGRVLTIATGILAIVAIYYTASNARTARRAQAHSEEVARRAHAHSEEVARRAQEAAQLSHDLAVRTAERTAELTEQGQVTERYTKAIEQLGSDKLDIRIGGIYALERIARDSARDHPTVVEVLAAFVREHSHVEDANAPATGAALKYDPDDVGRLRPDLQASLTVIARRDTDRDTDPVDLSAARLHRAYLANAHLTRADLTGADLLRATLTRATLLRATLTDANLTGANLYRATLANAYLASAILTGANLNDATLTEAYLARATLTEAYLTGATLTGAILRGATLVGARMVDATLTGADLRGADLRGADLRQADLRGTHLREADLTGADLTGAIGADLSGTKGTPIVPPAPGVSQ